MTTAEPLTLMVPDGTLAGHEHGIHRVDRRC